MIIRLPSSLHFPVTITVLLREKNDDVKQLAPLLVYTYAAKVMEYPEFGVEVETIQDLSSEFHCPVEGKLARWFVEVGTVVDSCNVKIAEIEEPCTHDVQWGGLCTMCGKDMTQLDYTWQSNSSRATVRPAPDNSGLLVSENEARRLEEDAKRRLLKSRKLSLVVDLDCTIIHATVDPTVGEWKADPHCVNYESVKDVQTFQLQDNVMGGRGTWYYVKLRPGLAEFLEHIAQLYELHIYTMGTRAYAMSIKKIVDPDGRLFGDRVLSRDENGNMSQKSLHKLFPVDTKMVVIIDDRGDVWKWSENLVKVRPYDFFVGIGDINSSFLPKQQVFPQGPPVNPVVDQPRPETIPLDTKDDTEEEVEDDTLMETDAEGLPAAASVTHLSALEQLITPEGGDSRQLLNTQTEDLDKALAAQKEDRPLARKQEMQDRLDEKAAEEAAAAENGETTDDTSSETRQKHSVLQDNDAELPPLKDHLAAIHKAFFEEYEKNKGKRQDRVSQLKKPKRKRLLEQDAEGLDLSAVPDVAHIMPRMKRQALNGCVIVFSGVIPLGADIQNSDIALWAKSFGASVVETLSSKVTHVIAARSRTAKVRQAASRYPSIKIVSPQWLYQTLTTWRREPEEPHLITIHPEDRAPPNGDLSNPLLSSEEDDGDSIDDLGDEVIDNLTEQEVMRNMDNVRWDDMDSELMEFMEGEDLDDDDSASESGSDVSATTSVSVRTRSRKRSRSTSPGPRPPSAAGQPGDAEDQPLTEVTDDAEAASRLAKRQKVARERGGSQLKVAESIDENNAPPNENSEGERTDEDDDDLAADLERELLAMSEAEAEGGAADGEGDATGADAEEEAEAATATATAATTTEEAKQAADTDDGTADAAASEAGKGGGDTG